MRNKQDKNRTRKKMGTTLGKRILALVLSFAMLITTIYVSELDGIFVNFPKIVHAATPTNIPKNINSLYELYKFSNEYDSTYKTANITINVSGDFVLEANHSFAAGDTTSGEAETLSYVPIGTQGNEFEGQINITQAENTPQIIRGTLPLFGYVCDDVEIYRTGSTTAQQLSLIRSSASTEPLFARNVVKGNNGTPAITWDFLISPYSVTTDSSTTVSVFDFGGIVGNIGSSATVNMSVDNAAVDGGGNGSNISSDDNAGLICGTLESSATVNVTFSGKSTDHGLNQNYSVTTNTSGKSAGGFIGEMNSGSTLNIYLPTATTDYDVDAAKSINATIGGTSYAGGLVGNNKGGAVNIYERTFTLAVEESEEDTISDTPVAYVSKDTVKAKTGAGGIFGYYIATADTDWTGKYATDTTDGCVVNAPSCGGYVGVMDGAGYNVTFAGTSSSHLSVLAKLTTGENIDNFGGLVGKYLSTDLTKTLDIEYIDVTIDYVSEPAINNNSAFGGLIGFVDGSDKDHSAVYMKVDNVSVTATRGYSKATYFGGIVGKTGNKGSMLDVGTVTVSTGGNDYKGGGIVGQMNAGVLRLSGKTDLTSAPARSSKSSDGNQTTGQIVGNRASAIVYALGSGTDDNATYENGWYFDRYSKTNNNYVDDIGNWGEVVRYNSSVNEIVEGEEKNVIKSIEDSTNGLLTYDSSTHTVTIAGAQKTMDSNADLVATALNIQLNEGINVGALCFADTTNNSSSLLADNLVIDGALSFANTGLTGFTRDNGTLNSFSGSLTGKTGRGTDSITMATGEAYGNYTSGNAGLGEIYAHLYNGLFWKINGASVYGLTITGTINHSSNVESARIGGLTSEITSTGDDDVSISNVVFSETINFAPVKNRKENYVGGVAGWVYKDNTKDISITSSTISPAINVTDTPTGADICVGGAIGYINSVNSFTTTISSSTISPKIDATSGSTREHWAMAGLIADIEYNGAEADSDTRTVVLSNNTITACEVKNNATKTAGGLLGYNWYNTNVTLAGNTFSSANLLYTNSTDFSAICYKATGYWQVASGGLDVDALTIADKSGAARAVNAVKSFGFIVDYGYHKKDSDKSAIYLEMQAADSFTLGSDGAGAGVAVPSMSSGVYDELVAYTSDDVLANKSGVISYYCKTNNGTLYMDGNNFNSYQNVFNTALTNGNSRYYYSIYQKKSDGGNQWKMLRWSLSVYCANNIISQFPDPFNGGAVTLKGGLGNVSYYPVDIDEGVTVNISDMEGITFRNYHFEKSEMVASNKGNTDVNTRSTLSSNSQHYLMHTGVFRNVAGNINLTGKARFQGTIGCTGDYSGVFINGILNGTVNTSSTTTNTITFGNGKDVAFDDSSLQMITTGETAPLKTDAGYLFINKIGSNATLNLNNVRINYGASNDTYASSLIGDVVGQKITLVFNNIKIDSRTDSDTANLTTVYTTKKSIFKNATLLNKFDVDSTSNATYNFSQEEDWGTTATTRSSSTGVTYGKEITDSKDYENKEKWYYDSTRYYTDATTRSTSVNGTYSFSSGYRPYVRYSSTDASGNTYNGDTSYTLREIKVNVKSVDMTDGCGTYDHPYLIDSTDKLIDLAATINGSSSPIANICLPKTVATQRDNYHNHWCAENGAVTCDANYSYDGSGKYTSDTEGAADWELDEVREYLAGAYYQVSGTIIINGNFVGLGASTASDSSTGKYAFRGVIVGINGGTIQNNTTVPFIKISNGCVVKNLTVNVNTGVTTNVVTSADKTHPFSYSQTNDYYGGLIGEIMGGDNIIDNVKMTFTKIQNRSVAVNNYLACVGGYVGVVVNGGLIFRNMTSEDTAFASTFTAGSGNTSYNFATATKYDRLYINPYVGRVINGYAINETGTFTEGVYNGDGTYSGDSKNYILDNSNKNYRIADVNPQNSNKLSKTTFVPSGDTDSMWQLSIPDGQSLFMLSLITQSGAGTAETADGAYQYGIGYTCADNNNRYDATTAALYPATHLAKYTDVGCTTTALSNESTPSEYNGVSDYVIARMDTTASANAIPYIIYQYTTADGSTYPLRTVTGHGTADTGSLTFSDGWYLKLTTQNGTYNLPDCFRGIGSICRYDRGNDIGANSAALPLDGTKTYGDTDNKFNIKLYGFDGNGSTINCNINYRIYRVDLDNYVYSVYKDSTNNNITGGYIHIGFGLFNSLTQISKVEYENINTKSYNLTDGYYIGNFTLSGNINVCEYETNGNPSTGDELRDKARNRYPVGGVIGAVPFGSYMNFYNLDINALTFDTKMSNAVGGYVGRTNITELDFQNGAGMSYIFMNGCDVSGLSVSANNAGVGGVLGVSYSGFTSIYVNTAKDNNVSTQGDDGYYKSSMSINLDDTTAKQECGAGGILGCMRNGYNVNVWLNNISVSGINSSSQIGNINSVFSENKAGLCAGSGGLIGYIRKAEYVIITNCEVGQINISGPSAGGLFGNIAYDTSYATYGKPPYVKIYNSKVYNDSSDSYRISGTNYSGGITGRFITNRTYVQKCTGYDEVTNKYVYDIDGCEVSKYTIEQRGSNTGIGVGGLIGEANNGNRSIVNSSVHGCVIKAYSAGTNGMGGIVGYTSKDIYGYNIACYDNTFEDYSGGSTSNCMIGNFLGYNNNSQNVKIIGFSRQDNVFTNTTSEDVEGETVTTTTATGISADCGNNTTKTFIVCSDYMGTNADTEEVTDDETGETTVVSTANMAVASGDLKNIGSLSEVSPGTNEDYFPYAITNPKTMMGSDKFLTSDGQYVDTSSIITAQKIIDDLGTNVTTYNNKSTYTTATVSSAVSGYLSATDDDDVHITTYDTEMGLPDASVDDFTILALGGSATGGNYTTEITNYIKMLTNTTEAYTSDVVGKYKITVYPCQYENGNYSIVTDAEHQGLTRNTSNQYIMDDTYADTLQPNNQFTLIDVQFMNPMNENEIAYHLFVPVLTKKMVKFEFRSAAMGATEYESTAYATKLAQANDPYAGNFDEWMTLFLQFKFTQSEMNDMLNTGKGLNWNSSKQVNFTYGSSKHLANSTEFVLLDANCGVDKEYYLTKAGMSTTSTTGNAAIDHVVFSSFKQKDGTTGFVPQTINDIAGIKIRYGDAVANGIYVECTNETTKANATVYAYDSSGENKKYFIAYNSETTIGDGYSNSRYNLTSSGDVTENYYLNIYAFSDDNNGNGHTNTAYEFTVSSPITLAGNVTCKRSTYTTSTVYLGNLFQQTMNINSENSKAMQVGDNTITATLTSSVSFADPANAAFFQGRLHNAGVKIYQGFLVNLKRYGEQGGLLPDALIYGSPDYSYSATLDGNVGRTQNDTLAENASFMYLEPIEIEIPAYESGVTWTSTHVENLTVTFTNTDEALRREFQPRYNSVYEGNGFTASANLAYAADDVMYSNIKKDGTSPARFYISAEEKIDLLFEADDQIVDDEYDKYGEQSKNRSSLGINSKYIDTGSKFAESYGNKEYIEAVASLDTSRIPDTYKNGDYNLVYTLSLWQKQDDPENDYGYTYVEVPIDTYLSNFKLNTDIDGDGTLSEIVNGTYVSKSVNGNGEYVYTFDLDQTMSNWAIAFDQTEEIFDARATFDVKTADDFENISTYIYANYKLRLDAQLVPKPGTQNLSSYTDSDWIVYTHAKVNAQFVTDGN